MRKPPPPRDVAEVCGNLDALMTVLRDPSRWPPLPPVELVPATADDLRAMTLTADDLHRWLLMEPVGNLASARGNAAPKFTPA